MIHKTLRDILRGTAAIRDRVDNGANSPGIYADNAPRNNTCKEYIVLSDVSANHSYSLSGEIGIRETIVQCDCYAETPERAYTLFELIRDRISGNPGHADIDSCLIIGGLGADPTPAKGGQNTWVYRYSKDFQVFHFETIPSLGV